MTTLPDPAHYNPDTVGEVWRVDYQARAAGARQWVRRHGIAPANRDAFRVCLLLIDVQNTFCIPGFELFVGGASGTAAVDDNRSLCGFIYRNLHVITRIMPTMDTHRALQIFHDHFLVDASGSHPAPFTSISAADIADGRWRFNVAVSDQLGVTPEYGQRYLEHYVDSLQREGKFALTVWPYHAMLGGIGHALVPAVEEAVFFHSIARDSQPDLVLKGTHPLTEHYSAFGPEVAAGPDGRPISAWDETRYLRLAEYDAVIIAGQAKSHCVAWTIADLLSRAEKQDDQLAERLYLLEDCTSPIVVPGGEDYTGPADAAFARFAAAGAHRVRSTDPIETWPGPVSRAAGSLVSGTARSLHALPDSLNLEG